MLKCKYTLVGLNLENLLFCLSAGGAVVSHVKKKNHTMTLTISSAHEKLLKQKCAELDIVIKKAKPVGIGHYLYNFPKYIGAFLGICCGIFYTYFSLSTITDIQYEIPTNHVCTNAQDCIYLSNNFENIKQYFVNNKLQVGQKFNNSIKNLQNGVIAQFELVKSCTIKRVGTSVYISFAEASGPQKKYTKIVSEYNAIIESITTFSGTAKVKAGDLVLAGDTLVEGNGVPPSAKIVAKVYLCGTVFFDTNSQQFKQTGKKFTTKSISAFGKTIIPSKACPYGLYKTTTTTKYLTNLFLPLKVTTTVYEEVELVSVKQDFEEQKEALFAKAKQNALSGVSQAPKTINYSVISENGQYKIDCYCMLELEIGKKV